MGQGNFYKRTIIYVAAVMSLSGCAYLKDQINRPTDPNLEKSMREMEQRTLWYQRGFDPLK